MTKHITDRREPGESGRLEKFAAVAREQGEGPHPASLELMKRAGAKSPEADVRVAQYTRIERGREA